MVIFHGYVKLPEGKLQYLNSFSMINPFNDKPNKKRSTETSVSGRCFCEVGVSATPVYGGFHRHGGTPISLDGFMGKSING